MASKYLEVDARADDDLMSPSEARPHRSHTKSLREWKAKLAQMWKKAGVSGQVGIAAVAAGFCAFLLKVIVPHEQWKDPDSVARVFVRILGLPGNLWMRGLALIVLPLIACNMMTSIGSLKNMPGARRLGLSAISYYAVTTFCAAIEGLIWTSLFIIPFVSASPDDQEALKEQLAELEALPKRSVMDQIEGIFYSMVPRNIVVAAYTNDLMGVIAFSMAMGWAISDTSRSALYAVVQEVNLISVKLIGVLVRYTPLGVFSLLLPNIAVADVSKLLSQAGMYVLGAYTGFIFHILVVYSMIYMIVCRKNPWNYLRNAIPAVLTGFGTASSAATLPVTFKCAEINGITPTVAKFILPLGATLNMDGTALSFPLAILFQACALGIPVTFGDMLVIAVLSTIASMGAAPIPSSGIVMLTMILNAMNIPQGSAFAMVIAIDWLVDRGSTIVNILGDSYAAAVLQHIYSLNPDMEAELERAAARPSFAEIVARATPRASRADELERPAPRSSRTDTEELLGKDDDRS
eukprot:GILK01006806.1.p1 GENE.GILK01006806.1~~GILK01006806.1.p1  ORF type:complete len:521 (-),score=77.63 GILK01006806.1:126-1688(-)